jgi:hypothetical protein
MVYGWERENKLLVPSYDGEVDRVMLSECFRLHDRLNKSIVNPILPT